MRWRFFWLSLVMPLLLATSMTLSSAPVQAAQTKIQPPIGKFHDLSHPVYVGDVGVHTHAALYRQILSKADGRMTAPLSTPHLGPVPVLPAAVTNMQGKRPLDWQPQYRVCTNGVAYAQPETSFGNVYYWLPVRGDNSLQYLVYYWCPSPYNAGGYNFSYTLESFTSGQYLTITTGQNCNVNSANCDVQGAALQRSDRTVFGNNEPVETFAVTPGEYVYDYSPPEDGHYAYRGINGLYGWNGSRYVYLVYNDPAYI